MKPASDIAKRLHISERILNSWRRKGLLTRYARLAKRGRPWAYDEEQVRDVAVSKGIWVPEIEEAP